MNKPGPKPKPAHLKRTKRNLYLTDAEYTYLLGRLEWLRDQVQLDTQRRAEK